MAIRFLVDVTRMYVRHLNHVSSSSETVACMSIRGLVRGAGPMRHDTSVSETRGSMVRSGPQAPAPMTKVRAGYSRLLACHRWDLAGMDVIILCRIVRHRCHASTLNPCCCCVARSRAHTMRTTLLLIAADRSMIIISWRPGSVFLPELRIFPINSPASCFLLGFLIRA